MLQATRQQYAGPQFTTGLARNIADVRAAQRLRYAVFSGEMGATVPGREQGIDCDFYDAYCDHLLVRDHHSGEVVGTYRLLNAAQAGRAGGFYSDQEFVLHGLDGLRGACVEAGRACIHPRYRNGAVLARLWMGITKYMLSGGYDYLIGCASVGMADGGMHAARVYAALSGESMSPPQWRVAPRCAAPLPPVTGSPDADVLPPLLKGYRRLGAWLCGAPAWDRDFNTADFFLLAAMTRVDRRYIERWSRS